MPKKKPSTEPSEPTPVAVPVNADNYAALAKPFIAADQSRMISRLPNPPDTRRQWGAWLAYFLRRGIPARMMGELDEFMVPAEWPHMFDTAATIQGDHKAGDAFVRLTKAGQRSVYLTADDDLGFRAHKPLKPQQRIPFRPYPRLWEFFASDSEAIRMLDQGLPFEFITGLSRDMAMGADRGILRDRLARKFKEEDDHWTHVHQSMKFPHHQEWCFPYKSPPFDISDFPDAPERE